MAAVDPKDLRPGDWFVWHELQPPAYLFVEHAEAGRIVAEHVENVRQYGPGGFQPASISTVDRRFERVAPPEDMRPPLPDDVGTMVLASVMEGSEITTKLLYLSQEPEPYGRKWTERGSGEWVRTDRIVDWRLIDGIDTVRPGGAS